MKRSLFLLATSAICAHDIVTPPGPWLTGPLLAPSATVTPFGNYEVEPYLYVTSYSGQYNSHWSPSREPNLCSLNSQTIVIIGLTEWMDIQIAPSVLYNRSKGESAVGMGDFPVFLDFQLIKPGKWPGIKFTLQETFPTGKYQKASHRADLSGFGTFATTSSLLFYQLFHIRGIHYLTTFLNFGYTLNSPLQVKGLNSYGKGSGRVRPGSIFQLLFSFEYSLTQNWAFAMDTVYTHTNTTKSSNSELGFPSQEQISIAPAIEYNFTEHFGIIAGSWLTLAGRNAPQFYSGVIAFDWTW